MMKRKTLLSLILALLLIQPIGAALAAPPLPASFYGTVTVNGANVPDGSEITAWINGTQYAVIASQTWNGSSVYGPLDVPGDDPDSPEVEGGVAGDAIVFKIGAQEAEQSATWQSGGGGELNLMAADDGGGDALYALYGAIGNHIVTVDQATGDATKLRTASGFTDIQGLTFDASTNTLLGIADSFTDPKLIRIDRTTGEVTVVGPIDLSDQDFTEAESMFFNPSDGLLYGAGGSFPDNNRSNQLVTIDPTTGEATEIVQITGTGDGGDADALIFIDDTLYITDAANGTTVLYTLDQATGVATPVGDIGVSGVVSLAYHADTQTLLGASAEGRLLLSISPSTGQGTVIGPTHTDVEFDGHIMRGLAFVPPVSALTCDDTELYPGDTIPVELIASGTDIYGGQVSCAVDPTIAQPQSALFGDFFTQPYLVGANQADATAGRWLGAISQQNPNPPVSGSGSLATVTYQAMSPGTTNVTCQPLFSDRDGFELPSSASACTMTVLDYGTISGTVTYQGRLAHPDIEVTATGPVTGTDLTDAAGDFLIEQLRGGSYDVEADAHAYLPTCTLADATSGQITNLSQAQLLGGDVAGDNGDSDGDGDYGDDEINIGDATLVSGAFGSDDAQADINADGTINVQDLSILGGNYELTGCQVW